MNTSGNSVSSSTAKGILGKSRVFLTGFARKLAQDPIFGGIVDLIAASILLTTSLALLPKGISLAPILLVLCAFIVISRSVFSYLIKNLARRKNSHPDGSDYPELQSALQRLYADRKKLSSRVDELSAIREVSLAVGSILDFNEMINALLSLVSDFFESQKVLVYITHEEDNSLKAVGASSHGKSIPSEKILQKNIPFGVGLVGGAAAEKSTLTASHPKRGYAVAIPLIMKSRVVGVLKLKDSNPEAFSPEKLRKIQAIAGAMAVALENSRLYKMAVTDGLTGLAVHRHFQHRLEDEFSRSKRYQNPLALLLTDIDHFKKFNDDYGHQTGDSVLRSVADLVQEEARETDAVCRYGGEEFAVICPQTDLEGAMLLAERIRARCKSMRHEDADGNKVLQVTLSIGVAIFTPGLEVRSELIERADKALYLCKENGRDRVETLDEETGEEIA